MPKMMKYLSVTVCTVYILALVNITLGDTEDENLACCPTGKMINFKMRQCWVPDTNDTATIRLSCDKFVRLTNFDIKNGSTVISIPNIKPKTFGPDVSCTGSEINKNRTSSRRIALICVKKEETSPIDLSILGYCMIISVVFLILTVVVYSSLEELRDLHGKSIINLCGSLAIGFGLLAIIQFLEYTDMNLCAVRGFLAYFFIIAAFFWTTAIAIQVLRNTRHPSIVDRGWKEFFCYAAFAWGSSTILTVIMAIVNFYPGDHLKPGIGLQHCWFFGKEQQWYYMYSVMTILISINIFIFIYTSTIVWRHTFSSGHIKALRYRFMLTIRLIIVMGLFWMFEMISSLAGKHIIWSILDIVNTLQGPLIFLVLVVFRKRVIKAMLRHGWLDCIAGTVEMYLAAGTDEEDNVIQHTDIPMNDNETDKN